MVADGQGLAEARARRAALDLLAAAEAVAAAEGFRSPGREIKALADAALMYWWATTARWVPEATAGRAGRLMLVRGGVGR